MTLPSHIKKRINKAREAKDADLYRLAQAQKLIDEYHQMRYCGTGLPRKPIPAGRYLVHNQVKPVPKLGLNGFRAWTQNERDNLVECHCDFGGCRNSELHKHYRVRQS